MARARFRRHALTDRGPSAVALSLGSWLLPIVWALLICIPLVYSVFISLRTATSYAKSPLAFPSVPTLQNFTTAWVSGNLAQAFLNNTIITVIAVAGVVFFAAAAAYAIVRWIGRGGTALYNYFLLGLIVPIQLGLPELFKIWANLHLVDTLAGVILIHVGANLPLAIFLYAGFLRSVPLEIEEAARIDGASQFRTFISIVLPLLKPATATVVILTSIGIWNDLIVSLFFLESPDKLTLSREALSFVGAYSSNVPVVFASAVLILAPVLVVFFALQRFFVSGITQGALRG